jgi:hypothetical protein
MNDNTDDVTTETTAVTSYSFTMTFTVGGIVDSTYTMEETLANLKRELSEFYGPDGFELTEFRVANEDELAVYRKFLGTEAAENPESIN